MLEPDADEEARRDRRHPRGRLPAARLERHATRHEPAEPLQVDEVRDLHPEPERPRRGEHRVREHEPAPQVDREPHRPAAEDIEPVRRADALRRRHFGDAPRRRRPGRDRGTGVIAGRIRRTVGVRRVRIPGTALRRGFTSPPASPSELVGGEDRALAARPQRGSRPRPPPRTRDTSRRRTRPSGRRRPGGTPCAAPRSIPGPAAVPPPASGPASRPRAAAAGPPRAPRGRPAAPAGPPRTPGRPSASYEGTRSTTVPA